MDQLGFRSPQLPDRLPDHWAKALAGLALLVLGLALLGGFLYHGWHRIAYVTAFTTMGLANLGWAIGSLLPEGPLSRLMRGAVSTLAAVMLLALGATLAFQLGCGS